MKSCHNDHATTVVSNPKKIVHVFPVPVVMTMAFVATNVLVATSALRVPEPDPIPGISFDT